MAGSATDSAPGTGTGTEVPAVSIVIPVYNEERNLEALYARLRPVMDGITGGVETILVDDGSADRSLEILRGYAAQDPRVKVVAFNRNYGQHAAVFAGFDASSGRTVVTLDADLQNPPEDIPKLLAKIAEGFDAVGGVREKRKDTFFRRWGSRQTNRFMRMTLKGVDLSDYGCMLRAYSRDVIDCMRRCEEKASFIPALACQFARRIAEVPVGHADRHAGESNYSFWRLLKLQADLITGFTTAPLRMLTFLGIGISAASVLFGIYILVMRVLFGSEWAAAGVFTLFAVVFFLLGGQFFALGLLGEYVGRIYTEVRKRPRSVVKETLNLGPRKREIAS